MTLNERLAVFAGWKHERDEDGTTYWRTPDGSSIQWDCPEYDADRNLIATELLPRLTKKERKALGSKLARLAVAPVLDDGGVYAYWLLTLPPAELAAAIAEVVES